MSADEIDDETRAEVIDLMVSFGTIGAVIALAITGHFLHAAVLGLGVTIARRVMYG